MKYWLMKTEPGAYSYEDLLADKRTHWDGVRNYQARNNMKAMKVGDLVLIYHSVKDKEIVGIAKVAKEYYQDPTTEDERWVVVDIVPVERLANSLSLSTVKEDPILRETKLVTQSRLSVMPFSKEQFERVMELGHYRLKIKN